MIRVTLPVPPSSNRYWRHYQNRTVLSEAAREYIERVRWLMTGTSPLLGDVAVTLHVYRPAKRGDLDNFQKVLFDALQGFAFVNDSQVTEIHAFRDDDKQNPRVEVTIEETTQS